jgi:putative DNA primase/helicase
MSYTIPKEVPRPNEEDEAEMKAYATREAFAKGCKDNRRFVSALPFMQGIMYKSATEFDTHNDLLCVTNGVLNLKTMKLLPHDPKYLMRTMSNVHYDVGAKSLKWDAFLDDVFGNDEELRGYVQRAVGYTLSGNNLEKAFFILKGESNSGKSVFLNVIGHILGGFYKKANIETFLQKSTMGGARPDLASMMNKRVVVASETNEGDRFDEKLIKDITGGEPLTCRDLYKGEVTYQPMFKIWLSTNVLPVVRDDSNGVWNRVKVVSFNNVVPSEKMDVHLTDKLRLDATGILNWCVAGYQMYLEDGLVEPVTLTDQVASYREENDLFGSFITDCFILNKTSKIERMAAFDIFNDWCLKTKSYQRGMSNRKFYKKIRDKGFNESRAVDTRYFDGLAVKVGNSAVKQVDGNKLFVEF